MGPLSVDLRVRIMEAYENGEGSVRELAERFMVAPKTVQNYRKLLGSTGSVMPRPHAGGRARKLDDVLVRQLLEEKSDWTLDELAMQYARRHGGEQVARSTMSQAVRRLEWTRKKKTSRASEQERPDVQQKRVEFAKKTKDVAPPEAGIL